VKIPRVTYLRAGAVSFYQGKSLLLHGTPYSLAICMIYMTCHIGDYLDIHISQTNPYLSCLIPFPSINTQTLFLGSLLFSYTGTSASLSSREDRFVSLSSKFRFGFTPSCELPATSAAEAIEFCLLVVLPARDDCL
jgi:hypothetical protein